MTNRDGCVRLADVPSGQSRCSVSKGTKHKVGESRKVGGEVVTERSEITWGVFIPFLVPSQVVQE